MASERVVTSLPTLAPFLTAGSLHRKAGMKKPPPREHRGQKAPEKAFHQFALRIRSETEQSLKSRLDSLDPILARLKPHGVDPQQVKHILEGALPPLDTFSPPFVSNRIAATKRQERRVLKLKADLVISSRGELEELARRLREEREMFQCIAARSHRKCRVTSEAITALMTYFQRCLPQRSTATRYKLTGAILTKLSTPSCFVCNRPHRFTDWRAVRARDMLKPRA